MTPLLYYLAAVNLVGMLIMGADKRRAKRHKWRVPEKVLFGLAVIGGSPGVLIGMLLFRHKTRHKSFTIGIPIIIALQLAAVWAFKTVIL